VLEHKETNRRRQIVLCARSINSGDQFRQLHALEMSDFFEVIPKGIFKANAGFVSIYYDGPFSDG
jgi:hypothetical protein